MRFSPCSRPSIHARRKRWPARERSGGTRPSSPRSSTSASRCRASSFIPPLPSRAWHEAHCNDSNDAATATLAATGEASAARAWTNVASPRGSTAHARGSNCDHGFAIRARDASSSMPSVWHAEQRRAAYASFPRVRSASSTTAVATDALRGVNVVERRASALAGTISSAPLGPRHRNSRLSCPPISVNTMRTRCEPAASVTLPLLRRCGATFAFSTTSASSIHSHEESSLPSVNVHCPDSGTSKSPEKRSAKRSSRVRSRTSTTSVTPFAVGCRPSSCGSSSPRTSSSKHSQSSPGAGAASALLACARNRCAARAVDSPPLRPKSCARSGRRSAGDRKNAATCAWSVRSASEAMSDSRWHAAQPSSENNCWPCAIAPLPTSAMRSAASAPC